MKTSLALAGLLLAFSTAAHAKPKAAVAPPPPAAVPLTPEAIGVKTIQAILRDRPIDSIVPYFEDDIRESVTPENIKGFRDQVAWLSGLIGDTLEVLMTGTQPLDSGRSAFFREYRLANETNKRAPLIVFHLMFKDSLSRRVSGAYNKSFADDTKNRISGEETWPVEGRDLSVHSVSYIEFDQGILPLVRVYDEDTTLFDSALAVRKGAPIARAAIARGVLEQVKGELHGRSLLEGFGIAFIRREPHMGYLQYKFGLKPENYDPEAAKKAAMKAAAAKKPVKKAGAKAPTKKPAAKKK